MVKRIFIVGGAGFIGSHLSALCSAQGHAVQVFDDFSTGKREFFSTNPEIEIVQDDIRNAGAVRTAIRNFEPDVVFHLAAIHHIPTCEKLPERTYAVNVEGLQSVLSACEESAVPRLVFASTGALYDYVEGSLREDSPIKAQGIYALSKFFGEHMVANYAVKTGNQALIARLFNNVGIHETNHHLIPDILKQLVEGKRTLTLGNLAPRRDYVHVKDVAAAFLALSLMPDPGSVETYNVGCGKECSVQDLVNELSSVIGESIEVISLPNLKRKVDRISQLADISKIRRATGWSPKLSLRDALQEVWEEALAAGKKPAERAPQTIPA